MDAVAITMDAVRKKADVRITTNQKKPWTSKPWRGGMQIVGVMRKEKVNWRIIKMIQKSELTQVPVEQRVPGRVYGVGDTLDGVLLHVDIHKNKNEGYWAHWKYWFALPESMLPVREVMPELDKMYEFDSVGFNGLLGRLVGFQVQMPGSSGTITVTSIRHIQTLPSLTIPSGTKSEQIAELEKILAELKQS